jgi:hypothetical protein
MSGGILGGLFGGGNAPQAGNGILGDLAQALADNSGMLMGYGADGFGGALQGMQVDEQTRRLKQAEAERERQRAAAQQLAQKLGTPELADMPDVLSSVAASRYKPKELSFEERQFNALTPEQQAQYRQSKFLGGASPTDDMREYTFDMQQRQATGQSIVPFGEWLASVKKPGTVVNNLPAQVEKTEEVERAKLNTKYLSDLSAQSGTIARRSADLDFLGRVVSRTNTGTGADTRAMLDGIGNSLGMSPGTLKTQADAIKAVTNRIAPTLRAEGSGSQSDAELAGFLAALPNLTASPQGNQLIQATLQRAAKIDRERAKIASQFSAGRITATEARQKIAELDEQSIYASEEEKKIIDNAMGFAPLSGGEKGAKGWKILGWE